MKCLPLAGLAMSLSTASVSALEAHVTNSTPVSAVKAWQVVGDFCGIAAWHPAVERCELYDVMGAKVRRITLKDGGSIREQLVEQDADTFVQRTLFLDGTLPVSNYQGTLKVVVSGAGAAYHWSGNFKAIGVSDAEAIRSITGFYTAGIGALVEKSTK